MHGHRRGGRVRLRSPLAPPANVRLFCSCAYILLLLLLLRFIEVVPDCETTASIQKVCFTNAPGARPHSTALTLNRPFDGTHRKLAVRRRCSRTRCSPTGSRNTTHKVLPPSRVPGTSPFARSPLFPLPLRSCVRAHTEDQWAGVEDNFIRSCAGYCGTDQIIINLFHIINSICNYLLILFR